MMPTHPEHLIVIECTTILDFRGNGVVDCLQNTHNNLHVDMPSIVNAPRSTLGASSARNAWVR